MLSRLQPPIYIANDMFRPKIKIPWKKSSLCPCGSGKTLNRCCAGIDGTPRSKPFNLNKTERKTGLNRSGCYLAGQDNCGAKLSLEHALSHNIIDPLGDLAIRGFPGVDGETDVVVPKGSAGYKVLCNLHNADLSPLDAQAGRVFAELGAAIFPIRHPANKERENWVYIDGPRLESFSLKALAAYVAAKVITRSGKKVELNVDWTKLKRAILAGDLDDGGGMYICASPAPNEVDGCQFIPISNLDGQLVGIHCVMRGFSFRTIFDPTHAGAGTVPPNATFRPSVHQLYGIGGSAFIYLAWRRRANLRQYSSGRVITTPTGSSSSVPFDLLAGSPKEEIRTKLLQQPTEMPQSFAPIDVGHFEADPPPILGRSKR